MIRKIREFVKLVTEKKDSKLEKLELKVISEKEAELIKLKTGLNVSGFKRILDNNGVNHTIKNHGKEKIESLRGQIAVTLEDFEKIPRIVKSENVIYGGKTKIGLDCILYEATIDNTFFYVEEVRTGKKELCIKSIRKRKPTK